MWKPTQQYSGWVPPISSDELYHSAKGSHWKKHKYISVKDGVYKYAKKAGDFVQDKVWDAEIAIDDAKDAVTGAASRAKDKFEQRTGIADKKAYERYKYKFDEADKAENEAYDNYQWHKHRERMANIHNSKSWAEIEKSMQESAREKMKLAEERKYGEYGVYDKMKAAEDRYRGSTVGKIDKAVENGKAKVNKLLGKKKKDTKSSSTDKWEEYYETEQKAIKEARKSRAERSKQKAISNKKKSDDKKHSDYLKKKNASTKAKSSVKAKKNKQYSR